MSGNLAEVMAQAKRAQAVQEVAREEVDAISTSTPRKRTGKVGKHRDPNFTKITAYIRETTRKAAARRLIEDGRELSEIVEHLLDGWTSGSIDA